VLNPSRTKKLQLKLLQLPNNLIICDGDDNDGPEDLDCHRSYGRPKVDKKVIDLDNESLSDYVIVRLAVATAKAMQKYRETYIEA
jgi:hypothetical protein